MLDDDMISRIEAIVDAKLEAMERRIIEAVDRLAVRVDELSGHRGNGQDKPSPWSRP